MGKRGRAEDKGKGEGDDLIGIFKSSCHIHINVVCLIEDRLLGSCLCSAESTSVVAASAVGVLGAFAPEVEMAVPSVWRGGVLDSLEHLGKRVLSHRGHERGGEGGIQGRRKIGRVEMIVSSVWWDGVLGSLEHLGRRVLSHRSVYGRDGEDRIRSQR